MNLNVLRRGINCHRYFIYAAETLKRPRESQEMRVKKEAVKELKSCLAHKLGKNETLASVRKVIEENYKNDGTLLAKSFEYQRNIIERRFERLVVYIYDNGINTRIAAIDVRITAPADICIADVGVQDDSIDDVLDLVIKEGRRYRGVKLSVGKCEYSAKPSAKSWEGTDVALPVIFLGLRQKKIQATAEEWFLEGKEDNTLTGELPAFEEKRCYNIALQEYKIESDAHNAIANFLMKDEEPSDCSFCKFKRECNMTSYEGLHLITPQKENGEVHFTEEQQKVIEHADGPAAVIAVPGSGKTFTISYRFKQLVESGIKPERILCITYTQSAAKDMETKIKRVCDKVTGSMDNITTFNAFGYKILCDNPMYVRDGSARCVVEDASSKRRLLMQAMDECPEITSLSYARTKGQYGVLTRFLSKLKILEDSGLDAFLAKYQREDTEGMLRVYQRYKDLLYEGGYITFDEQVTFVNKAFAEYPRLLARIAEKYSYIMVDEFQDCNAEQRDMIYTLGKAIGGNIVVIGDDDQSIYSFRGGTNRYLREFGKDWEGAKILTLSTNFRSKEMILELGKSIITSNEGRYDKELHGTGDGGPIPEYYRGDESTVAELVKKTLEKEKCKPSDICVLARNNAVLENIGNRLERLGINSSHPKDFLINDAVFNAMLAVFNFVSNHDDDDAVATLFRWFNKPLPHKTANLNSFYQNCVHAGLLGTVESYDFVTDVISEDSIRFECSDTPEDTFRKVMLRIYLMTSALTEENLQLKEAIEKCCRLLLIPEGYMVVDNITEIVDLEGFTDYSELEKHMEEMIDFEDQTRIIYDIDPEKVRLVTSHDSKGHEYPHVILFGLYAFDGESDEDVRLLYVSVTRAQKSFSIVEIPTSAYDGNKKKPFSKFDELIKSHVKMAV